MNGLNIKEKRKKINFLSLDRGEAEVSPQTGSPLICQAASPLGLDSNLPNIQALNQIDQILARSSLHLVLTY